MPHGSGAKRISGQTDSVPRAGGSLSRIVRVDLCTLEQDPPQFGSAQFRSKLFGSGRFQFWISLSDVFFLFFHFHLIFLVRRLSRACCGTREQKHSNKLRDVVKNLYKLMFSGSGRGLSILEIATMIHRE